MRAVRCIISLVIIFSLVALVQFFPSGAGDSSQSRTTLDPFQSIIIQSDEDLLMWDIPGTGVEGDPYIISDLIINSATKGYGISIYDTTLHLEIRDCDIYYDDDNNDYNYDVYGMTLYDVDNVTVTGCNVMDQGEHAIYIRHSENVLIEDTNCSDADSDGIYISESKYIKVRECELFNNTAGIDCYYSNVVSITDNQIGNSRADGIYLRQSTFVTAHGNTISSKTYCIDLDMCEKITISGSTMSGRNGIDTDEIRSMVIRDCTIDCKYDPVELRDCQRVTMRDVVMTGTGIVIDGSYLDSWNTHDIDTSNLLNSKPVHYLTNLSGGQVPDIEGQLIMANCDALMISGIELKDLHVGLQAGYCSDVIFDDISFVNNINYGMLMRSCEVCTVSNCSFTGSEYGSGLALFDCSFNTIQDCVAKDNTGDGIYLSGCVGNVLINNTLEKNSDGVIMYYSDVNSFDNNTFANNYGTGFYSSYSDANMFTGNKVFGNGMEEGGYFEVEDYSYFMGSSNGVGMYLYDSDGSIIINNSFGRNNEPSLNLYSSNDVRLYHNKFEEAGLQIEGSSLDHWNQHTIGPTNLVNDRPIGYIIDQKDQVIDGEYGQLIVSNCSGITIRNLTINWTDVGISLGGVYNVVVDNVTISDSMIGIDVWMVENAVIGNNTISDMHDKGITVNWAWDVWVCDNVITNTSGPGIETDYSDMVSLRDNQLFGSGFGFDLNNIWSYFPYTDLITNNTVNGRPLRIVRDLNNEVYREEAGQLVMYNCTDSTIIGQNLSDGSMGLLASYCSNNLFVGLDCSGNSEGMMLLSSNSNKIMYSQFNDNENGLYLSSSYSNRITNCTFSGNSRFGLNIGWDSYYNRAYHNNFIDNEAHINANEWWNYFNQTEGDGNYYSDMQTIYPDATHDGVWWDTPFEVEFYYYWYYLAETGIYDHYPIVEPVDTSYPILGDISMRTGTTGDRFTFQAFIYSPNATDVEVTYWNEDPSNKTTSVMSSSNDMLYELSVTIPYTSLEPLRYQISFKDQFDIERMSQVTMVTIIDNDPPHVDAGSTITALIGDSIKFNGTSSHDNIGIVLYTWTMRLENETVVYNTVSGEHVFTEAGYYPMRLTAMDAAGNFATDTLNILIPQPLSIFVDIGPVRGAKGMALEGANVTVQFNGQEYKARTDDEGYIVVEMPSTVVGTSLNISASMEGYENMTYSTLVTDDGSLEERPPIMKEVKEDGGGGSGADFLTWLLIGIAILVLVALVSAGVYFMVKSRVWADAHEDIVDVLGPKKKADVPDDELPEAKEREEPTEDKPKKKSSSTKRRKGIPKKGSSKKRNKKA